MATGIQPDGSGKASRRSRNTMRVKPYAIRSPPRNARHTALPAPGGQMSTSGCSCRYRSSLRTWSGGPGGTSCTGQYRHPASGQRNGFPKSPATRHRRRGYERPPPSRTCQYAGQTPVPRSSCCQAAPIHHRTAGCRRALARLYRAQIRRRPGLETVVARGSAGGPAAAGGQEVPDLRVVVCPDIDPSRCRARHHPADRVAHETVQPEQRAIWYLSAELHWYSSDMRVQRFISIVTGPGDGLVVAS